MGLNSLNSKSTAVAAAGAQEEELFLLQNAKADLHPSQDDAIILDGFFGLDIHEWYWKWYTVRSNIAYFKEGWAHHQRPRYECIHC